MPQVGVPLPFCMGSCKPYPWQIHACGGTLMAQVLSRTHFNQPIQLARFDSPSEESEPEMLCPVRALKVELSSSLSHQGFIET